MYNVEVSNDDGQDKIVTFRMPVLAQASIYHEAKSLNASDLRRWEENSNKDVSWGPLQPVETLNAQNRLKVMTALLFVYNQQLSLIQKSALAHLCRAASQLANQGFTKPGHAHRASYGTDPSQAIAPKPLPRIPMSSPFLVEMLHSVYFAMFNEFGSIAIQSVEDIHNRACYELFHDVILVSNAIRNSLHANPSGNFIQFSTIKHNINRICICGSGQPSDGPMGISVALTPSTTTVTVSKSMITNASFRTKKLPGKWHGQRLIFLHSSIHQPNTTLHFVSPPPPPHCPKPNSHTPLAMLSIVISQFTRCSSDEFFSVILLCVERVVDIGVCLCCYICFCMICSLILLCVLIER